MNPTHRGPLAATILALTLAGTAQAASDLAISQVYGGGGNSGAPYTHDFVELFNRGPVPVSLDGKSVQYGSSTGSFTQSVALPATTLQPGQYFLLQLASGANGVALPVSPDATSTNPNLSGTNGKVALVEGAATLNCGTSAAPCGEAQLALVIDLVGFGSANLFEGTSATPTLSNTTAAFRADGGCTDSDDNGADFSTAAPLPRNTGSPVNTCALSTDPTDPTGNGSASPSSLANGDSTLLTVTVTPGRNPDSTGIVVTGDLTAIGGSASQGFRDDGLQGDATAGDNVFSFETVVSAAAGAVSLPVNVVDDQARSTDTNIALSVVGEFLIPEIQGTGTGSPLAIGTQVLTEGIVTARRGNGYFIQSAPGDEDGDPATAEGLFVFTGGTPPVDAAVGNRLRIGGTITSFSRTPHGYPLTQLGSSSFTVLSTGNPLPPAVLIDASVLSEGVALDAMGRYQGMRVELPAAVVVGPTNGFGDFYVTLPETVRPAREPGIAALDAVPLPPENNIPVFDRNPERLRVESTGLEAGTALNLDAGTQLQGMAGVMYYDRGDFSLLLGDNSGIVASGGAFVAAVPAAPVGAVRVGSYNIENFALTGDFITRLDKLSEVFCQYLRNPDVVGLVEIANLAAAERLASAINTNEFGTCPESPQYQAYVLSNSGTQRLGFLVKTAPVEAGGPRVVVDAITEMFTTEPLVAPDLSTNSGVLFDRAPLMLNARVKGENGEEFPLTVLLNHTLSLLDVNSLATRSDSWGTAGNRSRGKRLQQAVMLSELVEAIQTDETPANLVLIGDYNSFNFSDGYVDVMGIIGGTPAPADQVLEYGASAVTRPLVNLIGTKPEAEQYSYVFEGNIQTLDHALVNDTVLANTRARLYHARVNSDFATDNAADPTVPVRTSDHDPLVAELRVADFLDADLSVAVTSPGKPVVSGNQVVFRAEVANLGSAPAVEPALTIEIGTPSFRLYPVQAAGWTCSAPVDIDTGSRIACQRDAELDAGAIDNLSIRFDAVRLGAIEDVDLVITASTFSRDAVPANDSATGSARIVGRPQNPFNR
ncbi:MAG TPA: lamin tail domain-containing protein [Arenimonas sp.]|uniref:lamin tail domain-containing protein n=1 Tax=Arenimonas sp. TaxID=1872635 RepID=UPI002D7F5FC4|nr:lamin tail domain-containing protein [Arenimonas sp.]HEU0152443.1 lamin tail domain-containing protein [Arenimonas sp.]